MAPVRLTRVVAFSAAHRYYRPEWSPQRNAEVFGACANEHGHGHTYHCHVTVTGAVHGDSGMVMDLDALDQVMREEITQRFDHRHLNYDVPEFAFGKQVPTSEAMAIYIWDRIAVRMPAGVHLERVRVQEDAYLYAEYDGPDADA